MKYLKMLSLAAVAAGVLMVAIGSGAASATVLCKEPGTGSPTGTTCPSGQAYGTGTVIHAVNEATSTLTTSFKNIECLTTTFQGKTSNEGSASETAVVSIETMTLVNCNCSFNVLKGGSLEIHWISGTNNGTLTSSGTEVTTSCSTIFGTVHCIFATNATDLGTVTGGATGTIDIPSADLPRLSTNALCDESANWDVKYEITTPKPLYVTAHT